MLAANRHLACLRCRAAGRQQQRRGAKSRRKHVGGQERGVLRSDFAPAAAAPSRRAQLIRNIGIVAHIDAGKTTCTERMLYAAGRTTHVGRVDSGDAATDFLPVERQRGITVNSAAVCFQWRGHTINLIDTPGHVDFSVEVRRCVRALDACVLVLDASAGVQPQTVAVWREARKRRLPTIAFANKMDKRAAAVAKCTASIERKLGIVPLVTQMLAPGHGSFHWDDGGLELVDLVAGVAHAWRPDRYGHVQMQSREVQPSCSYAGAFLSARDELVDLVCEHDELLADAVLEQESLRHDRVLRELPLAIRRLTLSGEAMPLLIGSALKQLGVECILDGVVDYLPDPWECSDGVDPDDGLCALAFKTEFDKHLGELTFLRIYSGSIVAGEPFRNATRGAPEVAAALHRPDSERLVPIVSAGAGHICVATGLKDTVTGDTLAQATDGPASGAALLLGVDVPEPVIFCSIEAPSVRDEQRFDAALAQMCRQDPSMRARRDADTGATVLEAQGELHVQIIKDRLLREYGLDAYVGPLQVAYREAVTQVAEATATLTERSAGRLVEFTLDVQVAPQPDAGTVHEVKFAAERGVTNLEHRRADWQRAISAGCANAALQGPLLGFRVFDTAVTVTRVEASGQRVSHALISAAAAQCTERAMREAGTRLIEPIMLVEVSLDDEGTGRPAVLSELAARRAHVLQASGAGTAEDGYGDEEQNSIVARAPLAQLQGWAQVARTLTRGTAGVHVRTDSYAPMNPADQQKLVRRGAFAL